jgi:hypothetical protein
MGRFETRGGAWLGRHLPGLMHFIMTRAGRHTTIATPKKTGS